MIHFIYQQIYFYATKSQGWIFSESENEKWEIKSKFFYMYHVMYNESCYVPYIMLFAMYNVIYHV